MQNRGISQAVIRRLPRYYRYLGELIEQGVERISSNELSKRMKVTASQIRQDHNIIIIGAGNLGRALANYASFEKRGFILKGLFDINPELDGQEVRGVPIHMMDELPKFVDENSIDIAALTIPKDESIKVAKFLADHNVHGIWNFAHTDLNLPESVIVENVHLSESLMRLSYNICRYKEEHN